MKKLLLFFLGQILQDFKVEALPAFFNFNSRLFPFGGQGDCGDPLVALGAFADDQALAFEPCYEFADGGRLDMEQDAELLLGKLAPAF